LVRAQQGTAQAAGRMTRPRLLIHVVANLDKSVEFFRQGMDFELATPPGPLTTSTSTLVQKAVATTPGAKATAATLAIPGSNLSLQLIQFSGIEGKAFTQRLYDP